MYYAYIRVSTKNQDLTRQFELITTYCQRHKIKIEHYYQDKSTGTNFNREEYNKLIDNTVKKGDTIILTELDRLGRNNKELKEQIHKITKIRECNIIFVSQPFLNTENKSDSEKELIYNLTIEIFSWLAQKETELRKERQRVAIATSEVVNGKKYSRKKNSYYGRPNYSTFINVNDVEKMLKANKKDIEIMEKLGIKRTTFYKIKKDLKDKGVI